MYLDGLLFIANNLLVVIASFVLAKLVAGGREFWSVVLISVANYFVIIHFIVLTLGLSGLLSAYWALIVLIATNIILVALANRRECDLKSIGKLAKIPENVNLFYKGLLGISIFLLFALISRWLDFAVFKETVLKWDDLSYHAALVAGVLAQQEISLIPFTYQAYYPFGAELLSLWFMLPYGDDTYVSLSGLYWGMLGALSLFVVVIKTVKRTSDAALLAALFLSSGVVMGRAQTFSATDLAGPVLIMTAVTITMLAQLGELKRKGIYIVYSGLISGLAMGCKVTLVPASLVILAWWMVLTKSDKVKRNIVSTLMLFGIPFLLAGGYWYLRNLVLTGNPLFPAELGPFPGPFDADAQGRTKAWGWIMSEGLSWETISRILQWPYLTAAIAGSGFLISVFPVAYAKDGSSKKINIFEVDKILLAIGLITICLSPFMPFSGTNNRPYSELSLSPRYLILAFMCGLLLYRRLLVREPPISFIASGLMLIAATQALYSTSSALNSLVAILGGICGVFLILNPPVLLKKYRLMLALSGFPILLLGLVAWYPVKQVKTSEALFAYPGEKKPIGRAWQELESLQAGSKIGFFMSEPYQYTHFYPLFGRKLQLVPVPLTDMGLQRGFLHVNWEKDYNNWWQDWTYDGHVWRRATKAIQPDEFVENLRAASVDYVLTSKWSMNAWPDQDKWLKKSGMADTVYTDGYSTIWRIVE